jgi:lipopolysaccharide/colanic/teichoic acid biosynthesis glycosyltransferase
VSHTTLGGDILGWYEQGSVIGLIRSLGPAVAKAVPTPVNAVRELMHCLTPDSLDRCSIHFEVYSSRSDLVPRVFHMERDRWMTQVVRDAAKRTLDVVGSLALLFATAPLFLIVSALVKLTSPGPVFFRQLRVGQGGRPFTMLKFRTMYVNADHGIHRQYVERFIESREPSGSAKSFFKIVDDARVTTLGHFLRKSSLDEVPQFWNVLRGEMSLVGPRPPLPYEVAKYERWHWRRVFEAKPGITGPWQVYGRSRMSFDEMVRLDLRYAKDHSIWTDLKILLATPLAVLSGKGAH